MKKWILQYGRDSRLYSIPYKLSHSLCDFFSLSSKGKIQIVHEIKNILYYIIQN